MNPLPPRPRLRDHLKPLLYPLPGDAGYAWLSRGLLWSALIMLFTAGVVLPYRLPESARSLDRALVGAPEPAASAAAVSQALPAGTRVRDCRDDSCPWLVVLPEGRFTMGSPQAEQGRDDDEGPQHPVRIGYRLALMETEVTRGQFAAFVDETGYRTEGGCFALDAGGTTFELAGVRGWRGPGFEQTDQHPVVCVNWNDAQAYAAWLSARTGQRYRLPSEAEWEYAARAGSTTRFSFGDRDSELCEHANVADRAAKAQIEAARGRTTAECDDGAAYTAPVRRYKPNAWGLYDMHGNVWEWVQDCGPAGSYEGAPVDGSAVEATARRASPPAQQQRQRSSTDGVAVDAPCEIRLLRGGAWVNDPRDARSAVRVDVDPTNRGSVTGLRLTRMLP